MSKMPHGWHLLCDNGDSELAGEIAEYLFCWSQNSTALLQQRYAADDMLQQLVAVVHGQRNSINSFLRQYQIPTNWMAGVCGIYTTPAG